MGVGAAAAVVVGDEVLVAVVIVGHSGQAPMPVRPGMDVCPTLKVTVAGSHPLGVDVIFPSRPQVGVNHEVLVVLLIVGHGRVHLLVWPNADGDLFAHPGAIPVDPCGVQITVGLGDLEVIDDQVLLLRGAKGHGGLPALNPGTGGHVEGLEHRPS